MSSSKPVLVLVRGIPGSGKSYLALAVQATLEKNRAVVVDPDATDYDSPEYTAHTKSLTAAGVEEKFHPYRFIRAQAHKAIEEGKVVVWTQAFTNLDGFSKTVVNLQNYAAEHGKQLPLLVVEVEVDEATARARAAKREAEIGRGVPTEAFERFLKDYKTFADAGFNTVVVHGEDDVTQSVANVVKAIEALDS
jgi:thymidylate kinase